MINNHCKCNCHNVSCAVNHRGSPCPGYKFNCSTCCLTGVTSGLPNPVLSKEAFEAVIRKPNNSLQHEKLKAKKLKTISSWQEYNTMMRFGNCSASQEILNSLLEDQAKLTREETINDMNEALYNL